MFLKLSSTGFAMLPNLTQSFSAILFAGSVWLVSSLLISQSVFAQSSEAATPSSPDNSEWVEASVRELRHSSQQWIQIDLSDQRLTAWEGDTPVFSIIVSTGRDSDATPTGVYAIETKYRTARMQGESQGKQYDIPDVPYTMYFSGSYAIHGAYWHSSFGNPVSSGCINVPVEGAAWLFDWANAGTPVVVQN
jgi:hypothetical protein